MSSAEKGTGGLTLPDASTVTPQPDWKISTAGAASLCKAMAPVSNTISAPPSSATRPATDVPRIDAVAFGSFSCIAPGFNFEILPEINLKLPFVTEADKEAVSTAEGS